MLFRSTRDGAISWQNTSFNNGNRVFRDPVVVNEEQLKAIEDQIEIYKANGDPTSAQLLIANLAAAPLQGTNMTFGQKNAAKFREFKTKILEARRTNAGYANAEEKERFRYVFDQFQKLRFTETPQKLAVHRKGLQKLFSDAGTPEAVEFLNELSKSDSSLVLTNQIQQQVQSGNKKPGGGFLWTQPEIDKLVMAGDLEPEDGETIKKMLPQIKSLTELGKGVGGSLVEPLVKGRILYGLANHGVTYNTDPGFKARIDGAVTGAMRVAFDTLSTKWQAQFDRTGTYPNENIVSREWQAETERILKSPTEEFYIAKNGTIPNLLQKTLPTGKPIEIQSPVASPQELQNLRSKAGPYITIQATANRTNPDDFDLYQRDRKSTRLNSSHVSESRMPSSA